MPRRRRKLSPIDTYHVMLRGINYQQIFEEELDYTKFLNILRECREISQFSLHAYCLMGNHVHLLLSVKEEPLALCLKRIQNRFVFWYNTKYDRIGSLFQGRYRSEPVLNEHGLLSVCRYIHQNPVKAGLSQNIEQYPWSSIHAYQGFCDELTDISVISACFPDSKAILDFLSQPSERSYLDIHPQKSIPVTDEKAKRIIFQLTECKNSSEFQKLDRSIRNATIKELRKNGLSTYQINRLSSLDIWNASPPASSA